MKLNIFGLCALLMVSGCSSNRYIVTSAQSVLGVSVSENPSTQLYEARLGLVLSQIAVIPGDTNDPSSYPDVLQEFRINNIFTGGLVYQRLAVGKNAVEQPGASLMFSKDSKGGLATNIISNFQLLLPRK